MSRVSAKATLANAIREPAHLWMLLFLILVTVGGICRWTSTGPIQDIWWAIGGPGMTILGIATIGLQLHTMPSIFFELSDERFHYQEDFRKLSFAWKDIEAIKIDPPRKRLTIWVRGKGYPLHYLGIPENEFNEVKQFLLAKVSEYGIAQK